MNDSIDIIGDKMNKRKKVGQLINKCINKQKMNKSNVKK